jgi:2-methylcitrate dehydratase PrpD
MSSLITAEVVNFILEKKPLSTKVKNKAVEHFVDGIGVMLAGSRTECVKILVDVIHSRGGNPLSTLVGFDFKTHPSDAALTNGTSGHVDDYDDTQLSTSPDRIYGLLTHPTVPVLAAALAIGEYVECSGKTFLEAFIIGFEVECKLAEAIKPEHYIRGFHTTGTIGSFGACTASGRILELNEEELRHALGITASLSSGIRANFGTMTKPLHAGMAASNGITACMLAKKGFTADKESLDGKWGYMNILSYGADSDKIIGKLGNPFSLIFPGASIKIFPCGSLGQPSMDSFLEIVLKEDLKPDDVREVRIRAGPNIIEPLRYTNPTNKLQAKFSLQFGLGCILVNRRAGIREYSDKVVNNMEIRKVMKKVKTILDPELAKMGTDKMRSIVEVELQDGYMINSFTDTVRGTPEKPLTNNEIYNKFHECASLKLKKDKIKLLFKTITTISNVSNIKHLTSLLRN